MSNFKIQRAVSNIRQTTTVFTPIVELVVNAIEAIEASNRAPGVIQIQVCRAAKQLELDDGEGEETRITDVLVRDNGIGFTQEHRNSFDTLYSEQKIALGGKGFGRLISLKYFSDLTVDSTFMSGDEKLRRRFHLGKDTELIVGESLSPVSSEEELRTTVSLVGEKTGKLPRKLSTIAKSLVELLLPYFTTQGYVCPRIELSEHNSDDCIVLNDYVNSEDGIIKEVPLKTPSFTLQATDGPKNFLVRVFKFYSPQNKVSKLSLVADRREVTEVSLAAYIPEFSDEFVEDNENIHKRKNFILKSYVFSEYLDENVLLERGDFSFQRDNDLLLGISKTDIERNAAELTKDAVLSQVVTRQEKKKEQLREYVEHQAPWYKPLLSSVNTSALSTSPTETEMDEVLHREKFRQERRVKEEVAAVLASNDPDELLSRTRDLASRVSESSKNELVHYVALRRQVLDLFSRSLELKDDGKYASEDAVHSIIFPTKTNSEATSYDSHNLWILDERLTFTTYLTSDVPLAGGTTQRPDILAFDRAVAFRAENEASNPVTIFEFKRPGRDDFCNPSSKDDPIEQIVRYVNAIRAGDYRTPKGREISVGATTPFYGYVVCDLTEKVKRWLHESKDFKAMPDGMGYFNWRGNINLYMEVLSWTKLLKDASMRNRAFFHKLGID